MMPINYVRRHFNRRAQILLLVFCTLTIAFFGAGVYAVVNSRVERGNICSEVKELRNDVRRALTILTRNSQEPRVLRAGRIIKKPHCEE